MWLQLISRLSSKMLQVLVCQSSFTADVAANDTMATIMANYAQPCTYLQQAAGILSTCCQSFTETRAHCLRHDYGRTLCSRRRWSQLFCRPRQQGWQLWFLQITERNFWLCGAMTHCDNETQVATLPFMQKPLTSATFPRERQCRGWFILHKNENTETQVQRCSLNGTWISNSWLSCITVLHFMCWGYSALPYKGCISDFR